MSTLLIILSGIIAFIVSFIYASNIRDRLEKAHIIGMTIWIIVAIWSLIFSLSGKYAIYTLLGALLAIVVLWLLKEKCGWNDQSFKMVETLTHNSLIYTILCIIPGILLIINFPYMNPFWLVLLSLGISAILVIVTRFLHVQFFTRTWTMILFFAFVIIADIVINPEYRKFSSSDIHKMDHVLNRNIIVENLFDVNALDLELMPFQELWINDLKVFDDTIYFTVYNVDNHYEAVVSIDLDSKENKELFRSDGAKYVYDYTVFNGKLLVATRDGFTVVDQGNQTLLNITYDNERLIYGAFGYDPGGLKYYQGDIVYSFGSLENVTYSANTHRVENSQFIDVNGTYQYEDVASTFPNMIYDAAGNPLTVEGYYRQFKVYQYDLSTHTNRLGASEIYSSMYTQSLKGIFMNEHTLIDVNGHLQLLPISYLKGYARGDDALYFSVDQTFVGRYSFSPVNYSDPGIYTSSLGGYRLASESLILYNNGLLLALVVVLQEKKQILFQENQNGNEA